MVRCRFAVRLPDREPVLLPDEQGSPAWQLAFDFLAIFNGIANEIDGIAEAGIVGFEVEAAYLGVPPGVIPEYEEGPLGALLQERLPDVLRREGGGPSTIIDQVRNERGRVRVSAKFLRDSNELHTINDSIYLENLFFDYPVPKSPAAEDEGVAISPNEASPVVRSDPHLTLLDALTASIKNGEQRLESLSGLIGAIRERLRQPLEDALNSHLRQVAQAQTASIDNEKPRHVDNLRLEDKQNTVDVVNHQLERLGLAIGYKGTACYLASAGGTSHGRFLLVPKGSKTAVLARVNLSDFLPLALIDAQPLREPLVEWREREQIRRAAQGDAQQKT